VPEKVIVGTPNLDAAVSSSRMRQPRARCDRVVAWVIAWVIVSFLMLAFAVL
jgi:t-SNARE complex subunit (syntaxin)